MNYVKALICIIAFALVAITSIAQQKIENLKIDWPDEYNWKVGSNQEDESVHMIEVVPGNETVENWSIIGSMMAVKGAKNVPMDVAMNMMFEQAQKSAIKPVLVELERNEKTANPWILFKIEASAFKDSKLPESQLYYIIQGETSLYSNFVAIKQKALPRKFVEKWSAIFKASELVYKKP